MVRSAAAFLGRNPAAWSQVQASAGADPVSLAFAGGSTATQECFRRALARAHFCPGGQRLNFVVQGGQGAVLTRLLPQNEVSGTQ